MGVVNAFLDAPVYRLQQSRDIIRPRQREANLLQRLISGINELLNAYTHFADLFKKPESILETPTDAFKDALEKVIFSSRVRIDRLTEELFRGQITPQQFHARMRAEVSRINLAAGFLGIRGIGNATVEALGSISERVARELIRLDNFMRDTFGANFTRDLTTAPISAPQFRAYSLRFASAGRATSTVAQTAMMQDLYGASIEVGGRLYMRRVLTPGAAHCDDCIAYAESGWIPVDDGTLPPPGVDCECQENCKCMLEFALASNPTNLPDDIAY